MKLLPLPSLLMSLAASLAAAQNVSTFTNPIWSGFHPDPTCVFVPEWDSTFFCTTSSFIMFPGLPIYASKDLVNWYHVSNAFSRSEQFPSMDFIARGATSGMYAPTLRYNEGTFYLMSTLASQALPGQNYSRWDNFILSTTNPFESESWSDPVQFDYPGIDPDPVWDDQGNVLVTGAFDGMNVLQAPIDLETGEVFPPYHQPWNGTGLVSPEAPHYYEKDGWYYLVLAEGGTRERHRATMARARNITGPFEEHPDNPVLTAYLNTESYFQAVGHVDLFQDASGQWWAVALANRAGGDYAEDPYNSNFPMGRETVLTPVTWEEGEWPVFANITGTMTGDFALPPTAELPQGAKVGLDDEIDFEPGSTLPLHLFHWRLPKKQHYAISPAGEGHENSLTLKSSRLNLTAFDGDATRGWGQTFLARKQAHTRFRFSVDVEYEGHLTREEQEVGVTALQDQSQHFDLGVVMLRDESRNCSVPHLRFRGISTTPFRLPERMKWVGEAYPMPEAWAGGKIRLQVEALNTTHYAFSAGPAGIDGEQEGEGEMRVFGYCRGNQLIPYYSGVVVGVYATSNGKYGEGSFTTYVSRWRYTGLEQVIEQPEFEAPLTWD